MVLRKVYFVPSWFKGFTTKAQRKPTWVNHSIEPRKNANGRECPHPCHPSHPW